MKLWGPKWNMFFAWHQSSSIFSVSSSAVLFFLRGGMILWLVEFLLCFHLFWRFVDVSELWMYSLFISCCWLFSWSLTVVCPVSDPCRPSPLPGARSHLSRPAPGLTWSDSRCEDLFFFFYPAPPPYSPAFAPGAWPATPSVLTASPRTASFHASAHDKSPPLPRPHPPTPVLSPQQQHIWSSLQRRQWERGRGRESACSVCMCVLSSL